MSNLPRNGFENEAAAEPALKRRPVALVQLIASLALALCTVIAATVVSIGFARAYDAATLLKLEASLTAAAADCERAAASKTALVLPATGTAAGIAPGQLIKPRLGDRLRG
jgi:hypothetical protein